MSTDRGYSAQGLPSVFGSEILGPTEHFIRISPVFHIHEDTLRAILLRQLSGSQSLIGWTTPAAFALAILISFLTADFKSAFSLNSEFWNALFAILFVATLVWAIVAFLGRRALPSTDAIIDEIRVGAFVVSSVVEGDQAIELAQDEPVDAA